MAAGRAYLDYNASTPLLPVARAAMIAALDAGANPSSVHREGCGARQIVDAARRSLAALAGARPDHVVFTSGATEAATTLLTQDWRFGRAPTRLSRLYVCATDHPALLSGGRFPRDRVEVLGVDSDGLLDMAALERALGGHDLSLGLPLVAIHLANNETGTIQPAAEIGAMTKAAGGVLVLDAVQAAGRIPLDIAALCADFLILSSHKIGGPMGAGAIVGASDIMMPVPLIVGGGQERGFRAGTENLPGIAGFGAAAGAASTALAAADAVRQRRDRLEAMLGAVAPGTEVFGRGAARLPNTSFFALPGVKAETAQIAFDLAGVALSAGSACSSGKVGPSHVLRAMGRDAQGGALRVSIGPSTGEAEIDRFERALRDILSRRPAETRAA